MAIDRYLYTKFKGKYRVFPELDLDTLDFPRDENGEIDSDYSDFFLKGKSNIKIKHGVGSEIMCYIPSNGVAYNVVRQYANAMLNKEYKDYNKAANELIKHNYINEIEFLDGECYFTFDVKYIDDLNKIVKLRTSGANISPLSSKNLPKAKYEISNSDMELYKESKNGIPPLAIGRLNSEFGKQNWGESYNKLLRESHLKAMFFFHKENRWNEYCEFLRKVKR